MSDLDLIKKEVAQANRLIAEMGLATGPTAERGHVSLRLPDDPGKFLIKGLGPALSQTKADHMVVCDMEGFKVSGPPEINLPNEVKMHSCLLRANPNIQSVVHVHPRYTVLMSVLQANLGPMCIEGLPLFKIPLPVFPSPRLIIREEDGVEVASMLGGSEAILLQGHGAATVGADMEDAVMNMLHLEEQARMNYWAYCAAGPSHPTLSADQVEEFVSNMRTMSGQKHLAPEVAPTPRKPGGVWNHYAAIAGNE